MDTPVSPSAPARYTPVVPTFSPYTSSSESAVRLAWRVTLAAFILFVVLVVGVPLAGNWYVNAAIEPRSSEVTPIDGVVFVQRRGGGDWLMANPDERIAPGDALRTAPNARAFVDLFDHSTILLYPDSTLRILRAERGRFRAERSVLVLDLMQGRARIGVAPPPDDGAAFIQLRTPNSQVHLSEGSYSADFGKGTTQVAVRLGEATAYSSHGAAVAKPGQRLLVDAAQPPLGGLPARRDLVENGLFAQRDGTLPAGWLFRDRSEQDPPGTIAWSSTAGTVTFERAGGGHGETLISQQLDVDLWDFDKVLLSAKLRVLDHTLSGGGWQGTEYPLLLRVVYRDAQGNVTTWYRGFYLHNQDGYPVRDGELLASTDWHRVDIDLLSLVPRPWRIQRIDVAAMGWNYTSAIGELRVWAE
ncbi:MAG: FecR domain-containing protein [Chloroflexi bacterium]|nr:FecR domain-containing protein [Chloroflexota bacterium]